jgi:beta-glucanase (GH16 family)
LGADWHVYGVDWEPDSITFYFDGKQVGHTLTNPPQQHPEYIYFDSEIFPFISMPDGPYTASMKVDYIRAWTRPQSP